jgi:crossover junction endodeoxyribonuclease RusA
METRTINLTLPYPPPLNNLYRTLMLKGVPVRVKTGRAKKFIKAVGKVCEVERVRPFAGEVKVDIHVYRPRRVGDLDGSFKAIFDALKGHAFEDDKQIVEIHAYRLDDKFNPRVEIEIFELQAVQRLFPEKPELKKEELW